LESEKAKPPIQRLLLSNEEAAEALGLSRNSFHAISSNGKLGPLPIRLTARPQWSAKELAAWVDAGCPGRDQWQRIRGEMKKVLTAEGV
jgi:hypothetical protein